MAHKPSRTDKRFLHDERGVMLMIVALAFPIIFGISAVAVDLGHLLAVRMEMHSAADASALAAAQSLDDEDQAQTIAVQYAELNMPTANNGVVLSAVDVVLGKWDTTSDSFTAAATPVNAVEVTLRRTSANGNPVGLYFAKMIGINTRDLTVKAVASVSVGESKYCILALNETDFGALTTSTVTMPNCGLAVASTDDSALKVTGTGTLTADNLCVAGGSAISGSVVLDPAPTEDCDDIPTDPLSGLEAPAFSGCDFTNFSVSSNNNDIVLSPGVYCGGISVSGSNNTLTLNAGEYIIDGGGISMNGGVFQDDGTDGVYIYNTSSSGTDFGDISFSGTSTVNLTMPTTGTYAGVLFHLDENSTDGADFTVAGGAQTAMEGAIYAPSNAVEYSGHSSLESSCVQIIADTVRLRGTTDNFDSESCGDSAIRIGATSAPRMRS